MNKKNILIIFIFSLIMTFIIYKINYKKNTTILLLGDNYIKKLTNENYSYYLKKKYKVNDNFIFDNKNYRDIENDIKNNYYIYNKSNKEYLNILISSTVIIVLSANNNEYISKCKKSNSVLKNYNDKIFIKTRNIINLINKISNSKIIIIGNYCSEYNEEISNYLNNLYKDYNYINMYELYKEYKNNNLEYHIYSEIINK